MLHFCRWKLWNLAVTTFFISDTLCGPKTTVLWSGSSSRAECSTTCQGHAASSTPTTAFLACHSDLATMRATLWEQRLSSGRAWVSRTSR